MKKLLAVIALLVLCLTPALAQQNLLTNGGFENGLNGWTTWDSPGYGNPDYLGTMGTRINGDLYVPGAHSGTNYASSQVGYGTAMGGAYQTIDVANGTYTVSGWASGGRGWDEYANGTWTLKAWDGAFPGGMAEGGVAVAGGGWAWMFGSTSVNVTSGKLTVGWVVEQTAPRLVAGHFDDISVVAAPVPEPSSILALMSGVIGLAGIAFRKR